MSNEARMCSENSAQAHFRLTASLVQYQRPGKYQILDGRITRERFKGLPLNDIESVYLGHSSLLVTIDNFCIGSVRAVT